jgi:hypothetical protein
MVGKHDAAAGLAEEDRHTSAGTGLPANDGSSDRMRSIVSGVNATAPPTG